MDFSRFNQAEQAQINSMIEQKQVDDFVNLLTTMTDRCFRECANDFTTKAVTGREKTCLQKCADRFLKHSELVYARFDELRQNYNPLQASAAPSTPSPDTPTPPTM